MVMNKKIILMSLKVISLTTTDVHVTVRVTVFEGVMNEAGI